MDLYPTPENPLPPGAACFAVTTRDGVNLRAMHAIPPDARGTVVLVGGRGDFIERYFETMGELMARGFAVAAFDFRGQGGSQRLLSNPLRGHVGSFRDFDEDFRAFMTHPVIDRLPRPYYCIAHSTGGNILLRSLVRQRWFTKAMALSPLIGLLYGAWPKLVVSVVVFLVTALGLGWMYLPGHRRGPLGRNDFPGNLLTLERKRWMRDSGVLEAAPKLGIGGPTFSWLKSARRATRRLQALGPGDNLTCPLLIVSAGLDQVVDSEAIHRFARRVPGVSLVTLRESLHEILTERDAIREQFFAIFDTFIGG